MEFTITWMVLYGLTLVLVINLTNLISHAFSKQNMVMNPLTGRTHYEVPDPGLFPMNYERQGLRSGTFLSMYSVILIFAFIALTIVAFIFCNHWWQVLIAFFIADIVATAYAKKCPLRLHSVRYYITQILTPLVLVASFIVLATDILKVC